MNLPQAPEKYSRENEAQTRLALRQADGANLKRGGDIERSRVFLTDTVTGARFQLVVTSGVLGVVAAP